MDPKEKVKNKNYFKYFIEIILGEWFRLFSFFSKKRQALNLKTGDKLLIVLMQGMGDGLMMVPFLKNLKLAGIKTTLVTVNNKLDELLKDEELVEEFIVFNKKITKLKFLKNIRAKKFKYSYLGVPSGTLSSFLFFLINTKYRLAHKKNLGLNKSNYFGANILLDFPENLHNTDRNLKTLEKLGVAQNEVDIKVNINNGLDSNDQYLKILQQKKDQGYKILGIHPGCDAANPYRRWPEIYFSQLSKGLEAKKIFSFYPIGPGEENIYDYLKTNNPESLVVKGVTIKPTANLIKECDIFLSTDSGLGHLAVSQDVPTLAIFGPADYSLTSPYPKHYIQTGEDCSPCFRMELNFKYNCPYDRKCIKKITPEMVESKLLEILKNERKNN